MVAKKTTTKKPAARTKSATNADDKELLKNTKTDTNAKPKAKAKTKVKAKAKVKAAVKARAKPKASKEKKPKKPKNYLNNKDMLAELRKCHENDRMTDEFGKMIRLLAERYAGRYGPEYRAHIDDMKSSAVANVVRAWRSFNAEKYDNPFAYFTQAIKHNFWQYVSQEKKHRLNRDHILISLGQTPSEAFMDDYEAARELERNPPPPDDELES